MFKVGDIIESAGKVKYKYLIILSSDGYLRLKDIDNGIICCNFKTMEQLEKYANGWKVV